MVGSKNADGPALKPRLYVGRKMMLPPPLLNDWFASGNMLANVSMALDSKHSAAMVGRALVVDEGENVGSGNVYALNLAVEITVE